MIFVRNIRKFKNSPIYLNYFRKNLSESFETIYKLKSKLDKRMIAIMNESSGGSKNWNLQSNWKSARNVAENMEQVRALIEIFIQVAYTSWGCTLQNLDPGKDIIIKLIEELGFDEIDNPYLGFIKVFYKLNKGVTLSKEDWIKLNDWGADDLISEADLYGTGLEGTNHLIFNANLYNNNDSDSYIKYFKVFSEKRVIESLNIYAMATFENSPYKALKKYTEGGTKGTGVFQGGDYREVRNIIFYQNPKNLLGNLWPIYFIKKAYNVGKNTHYKSEADEIAIGISKNNLDKLVKDTISGINKVLKDIVDNINEYIDRESKKAKNRKKKSFLSTIVKRTNQCLEDDTKTLKDYIKRLKSVKTKQEFDSVFDELKFFISNRMKVKEFLNRNKINVELYNSDSNYSPPKKTQLWTLNDFKGAINDFSDNEKEELVKYLKDIGIIK